MAPIIATLAMAGCTAGPQRRLRIRLAEPSAQV